MYNQLTHATQVARGNVKMVTAIVMMKIDRQVIPETAQEIAGIDGVVEVYSISGDFDAIAIIKVKEYDELAALVTERLLKMPGITGTQTHMAFQTYSKSDIDGMFSIGSDE
jgi:DNA-binding Lrp family transcriptional regulator